MLSMFYRYLFLVILTVISKVVCYNFSRSFTHEDWKHNHNKQDNVNATTGTKLVHDNNNAIISIGATTHRHSVDVNEDGSSLLIRFGFSNNGKDKNDKDDESILSLFHGSWLWSHDPKNIHPSSGQKMHMPILSFYSDGWKIQSSSIIEKEYIPVAARINNDKNDQKNCIKRKFPPNGSLHPIGGIYENVDDEMSVLDNITPQHQLPLLHIVWTRNNNNYQGNDTFMESFFDIEWLYRCRYDDKSLLFRQQQTIIRKENSINSSTTLTRVKFNDLLNPITHEEARFTLLNAIVHDGAAIVEDTPAPLLEQESVDSNNDVDIVATEKDNDWKAAPVAFIGRLLGGGCLSHTKLYGDVFHVQSIPDAHNIAYTNEALVPHQDLAYYESPPGLQLLHCIQNYGISGGESVLIDAIAAAEEFRQLTPHLFTLLTTCEATFLKQRQGADMAYRRPHIQLYDTSKTHKDISAPIISVHWSPPFEGPLLIPNDMVEMYYIAYAAFSRMLDNSLDLNKRLVPSIPEILEQKLVRYAKDYTWQHMLRPGETLIFNNQRMLHGRRAFTVVAEDKCNEVGRHLMGCYTNIDDTLNEYRLLRRSRFGTHRTIPFVRNVGNGSCGTN